MKYFLLLSFLLSTVFAETVNVVATGTYEQIKFAKSSPIPNETAFARKQALIFAKEAAIEEAGTTLYVSFSSHRTNTGIDKSRSDIKAIASALVRTKVILEGWNGNKYTVKINASVDVKDAEEVFEKADKRLQEISRLQKKNDDILKEMKKISKKMFSIGRNSHTATSKLELHQMNSKQKIEYFNQVKLLDEYQENVLLMETKFEKGTLLDIANQNEIADNNSFEAGKLAFDKHFIEMFKKDFKAKIFNINVRKNGDTADISFFIGIANKDYGNLRYPIKTWFPTESRDWKDGVRTHEEYGYLHFADTAVGERLAEWVEKNRNMAIKIKIGNRNYYTEKMVESISDESLSKFKKKLKFFRNYNGYMTERKIKNIPLKELSGIDSIRAELSYTTRNTSDKRKGKDYPLPKLREATEFYD